MSRLSETFPMESDAHISDNLRELVNAELMDGETIQWMDQPVPVFFSAAAIGIVLFAIPWTAFSIFWMCGAAGVFDINNAKFEFNALDPGRLMLAAFGIPFLLIGLGMLSVPLRMRRSMKQTVYVITDQRAMIIGREFGAFDIKSYYPTDFSRLHRTQKTNGIGDVYFHIKRSDDSSTEEGFQNLRNVREVEKILQDLKETQISSTI